MSWTFPCVIITISLVVSTIVCLIKIIVSMNNPDSPQPEEKDKGICYKCHSAICVCDEMKPEPEILRFFEITKIEKTTYLRRMAGEWTYLYGDEDGESFCASKQYLDKFKPEFGGYWVSTTEEYYSYMSKEDFEKKGS